MWYIYMLLCDKKTFYIGITNDLVDRIKKHYHKQTFFTKKFSELKLVHCENYRTKKEAARREKQIKRWNKAKKQMLVDRKLGINFCTGFAEDLLGRENLL
ncbi:MAG: GIY-YIG nuclease family protein [Candidatus Paceibacterales bacterium]